MQENLYIFIYRFDESDRTELSKMDLKPTHFLRGEERTIF